MGFFLHLRLLCLINKKSKQTEARLNAAVLKRIENASAECGHDRDNCPRLNYYKSSARFDSAKTRTQMHTVAPPGRSTYKNVTMARHIEFM